MAYPEKSTQVVEGLVLQKREGGIVELDIQRMAELNPITAIPNPHSAESIKKYFDSRRWAPPEINWVLTNRGIQPLVFNGHTRFFVAQNNPEIIQQLGDKGLACLDVTKNSLRELDISGRNYLLPSEHARLAVAPAISHEVIAAERVAAYILRSWEQSKPADSELSGLVVLQLLRLDRMALQEGSRILKQSGGYSEAELRAIESLTKVVNSSGKTPLECFAAGLQVMIYKPEAVSLTGGMAKQVAGLFSQTEVRAKLAQVFGSGFRNTRQAAYAVEQTSMAMVGLLQRTPKEKVDALLRVMMRDLRDPDISWEEVQKLIAKPTKDAYDLASAKLRREMAEEKFVAAYIRDQRQDLWVGRDRTPRLTDQELLRYENELSGFEVRMLEIFAHGNPGWQESARGYIRTGSDYLKNAKVFVKEAQGALAQLRNEANGNAKYRHVLTTHGLANAIREVTQDIESLQNAHESDYRKFKQMIDRRRGALEQYKDAVVIEEYANKARVRITVALLDQGAPVDGRKLDQLLSLVDAEYRKVLEEDLGRNGRRSPNFADLGNAAERASTRVAEQLELVAQYAKDTGNKRLFDRVLDGGYKLQAAYSEARNHYKEQPDVRPVELEAPDVVWLLKTFNPQTAERLQAELEKNQNLSPEVRRGLLAVLRVLQAYEPLLTAAEDEEARRVAGEIVKGQGIIYQATQTGR